jgi:hypothetical protein
MKVLLPTTLTGLEILSLKGHFCNFILFTTFTSTLRLLCKTYRMTYPYKNAQ